MFWTRNRTNGFECNGECKCNNLVLLMIKDNANTCFLIPFLKEHNFFFQFVLQSMYFSGLAPETLGRILSQLRRTVVNGGQILNVMFARHNCFGPKTPVSLSPHSIPVLFLKGIHDGLQTRAENHLCLGSILWVPAFHTRLGRKTQFQMVS